MSVAFRREGDEEHLEPKFELPIPAGPNLVTPRGAALIAAKVAELSAALVAAGADEEAAKAVKRVLRYWQTRQITAEVVPVPDGTRAAMGTVVRFCLNNQEQTLAITGDDEADPASGRIAFSAPLARALMGAEAGDWRDFAGREEAIEVLAVMRDEGAFG